MNENIEEEFFGKKIDDKNTKFPKIKYVSRKFIAYITAGRLPNIFELIAFFLLGEWYSIGYIPIKLTLPLILILVLNQFINGLVNMIYDKELDIFSRKIIIWIYKYISTKEMMFSSFIFSIICLVTAWFINLYVFILTLLMIFGSVIYSAPPRLKTKPPLDIAVNSLVFGVIPFLMGWFIIDNKINLNTILFVIISGLFVAVYFLLFTWLDVKTDSELKIETSCTKLGFNGTIIVSNILWLFLLIIEIIYLGLFSILTIVTFLCFPFIIAIKIFDMKVTGNRLKANSFYLFLMITTYIWITSVYFYLYLQTKSLIPLVMLVFWVVVILSDLKIYVIVVKRLYNALYRKV